MIRRVLAAFSRSLPLLALAPLLLLPACGDGGKPAPVADGEEVKTFKKAPETEKKPDGPGDSPPPIISGKTKEEIRVDKIARKLKDKYRKAREAWEQEEVLREMGELLGKNGKPVAKLVRSALKAKDEDLRIAALEVLAVVDPKNCAEELGAALGDEVDAVKIAAIRAWRKSGLDGIEPLLKALEHEFDQRVLTELAITLKEKAPALEAPRIGRLMKETPSLPALRHLVEYLEAHKAVGQLDVVLRLMDRDHADLRAACAKTLGSFGVKTKAVYEGLIRALEDQEEKVRAAAVESLRTLSGRSFGFDPKAADGVRASPLTQWKTWLDTQK